jgi:DNA-binding response OmpR family regulator
LKNILYLDDSVIALKLMRKALEGFAHVRLVPTLANALKIIADEEFDCLIVDHVLNDGDGIDFAREARKIERFRETPIILVSSGLSIGTRYAAMKAGINQSVNKPIAPHVFRDIVASQIENPFVEQVEAKALPAVTVQWESDEGAYEYSLASWTLIHGITKEETRRKMLEHLRTFLKERSSEWRSASNVKVVDYIIEAIEDPDLSGRKEENP